MVDVSTEQLCDLALDVLRRLARLEPQVRSLNQEISPTRLAFHELSERSPGTVPQ